MKQEDIERLKDICAKEGFEIIKHEGRYYIEEARNRVLWTELNFMNLAGYNVFRFGLSNPNEINREELKSFLTSQLEKFLNNELSSKVITYPENVTFTR